MRLIPKNKMLVINNMLSKDNMKSRSNGLFEASTIGRKSKRLEKKIPVLNRFVKRIRGNIIRRTTRTYSFRVLNTDTRESYTITPDPFTYKGNARQTQIKLKKWIEDIYGRIRNSDREILYHYPLGKAQVYIFKKPRDIRQTPMNHIGSLNIPNFIPNRLFQVNKNECVMDYLFYAYPEIFKDISKEFVYKLIYPERWERIHGGWVLKDEYNDGFYDTSRFLEESTDAGINTLQLLRICEHFKIPMRAFDSNMGRIEYYNCSSQRRIKGKKIRIPPLYYMVKNNHLYPLTQSYATSVRNSREHSFKQEKKKKPTKKVFHYLEHENQTPYQFAMSMMKKNNQEASQIRNSKGNMLFDIGDDVYIGETKQKVQPIIDLCKLNGITYEGQVRPSRFTNTFTDIISKSNFNSQASSVFNTFNRGQTHQGRCIENITAQMLINKKEVDIIKCHRSIFLNPNNNWFQYTAIDTFEPITNDEYIGTDGFYYLETNDTTLFTGDGLYTNKMIDVANKFKIRYTLHAVIEPSFKKDKNIFKKPTNDIMNLKDNNDEAIINLKKQIINCVAGVLGIITTSNQYLKINTDIGQVANDIIELEKDETKHIIIHKEDDYYFYGHESRSKLLSSHRPMYLQVIEQANIKLFELQQDIIKQGGTILFRYSDEIHYSCEKEITETDAYIHKPTSKDINTYSIEEPIKYPIHLIKTAIKRGAIQWKQQPENDSGSYNNIIKKLIKNGGVVQGAGGTGKSYILKKLKEELTKQNKTYQVSAYTNIASRLIDGDTLHKYFGMKPQTNEIEHNKIKNMNIPDYFIVDEMSMINTLFYNIMNEIKTHHPNTKIILMGDFHQIPPVNEEHLNFKDSYIIKDLTGGSIWKLTKNYRANDELPDFLQEITDYSNGMIKFLLRERLTTSTSLDDMVNGWNIGYNNLQHPVGQHISNMLNNHHATMVEPYDTPCNFKLIKGMKVICNISSKKTDIAKNSIFIVESYKDYKVGLKDVMFGDTHEIDIDFLCKNFLPAYIITSEKSQGQTLKGNVYIHQYKQILKEGGTYNKMYVALGRATGFDKLFLA